MRDLTRIATNKVLNEMVDTAIRQAIMLQIIGNRAGEIQNKLEMDGELYNYSKAAAFREGVAAVCYVLWQLYGGCPADSIVAIERIVAKHHKLSDVLGLDCQDYIRLYLDNFGVGGP